MTDLQKLVTPKQEQDLPLEDLDKLLESDNILDTIEEEFGEKFIQELGANLKADYDDDVISVTPFFNRQKAGRRLALQHREQKNNPWPGASNVKHPLITIASTQFGARAYPALIPGINVVKTKVSPTVKDARELSDKARRIATHMDYQLLEEMDDWEGDMDRLLSAMLPQDGTVFKKTYYDPDLNKVVSELIPFTDLIVDYDADSLEKAYRKSHKLYYTENQVTEKINSEYFREIDMSPPVALKEKDLAQQVFEMNRTKIDKSTQHLFVEMHTWEDFDEDGYEEPWIITFRHDTSEIVRINPGFEAKGVHLDEQGEILRIAPVEYFTKYGFMPNVESGIYDIGFNILLMPLVEAMNTLINQLIDSGSLHTLQAGFISKTFQIRGGAQRFRPGLWKSVNVFGNDIKNGIFPLPTKEPSQILFSLLGFIQESANNIASVKDILLGENPGQNQKVGTTQAVLEQGLKIFTAIYKRVHRSVKLELQKIYRLNALFLDEQQYFHIIGQEEREGIGKEDYSDDIQVIPVSDANIATDSQRQAKVEGIMKYLPLGTVNPVEVTRRGLEAENQTEIELLMEVPPPQPSFEEQIQMSELELEAQKLKQEFELEQINFRLKLIVELGKIEASERKSAIDAASAIVDTVQARVKANLDERKLEQDASQAKQKTEV